MTITAVLQSVNIINATDRATDLMSSNDNKKMYISTPVTSPVPSTNNHNNASNETSSPNTNPQPHFIGHTIKSEFSNTLLPVTKSIKLPPISSFDRLLTVIKQKQSNSPQPTVKLENQDQLALYQNLSQKRRSRTASLPMLAQHSINIPILPSNNTITNNGNQRLVPTPEAHIGTNSNNYFAPLKSQSSSPSVSTAMASPITLARSNGPYLLPLASSSTSNGDSSTDVFSAQSPPYYVHSCTATSVSTPRSELETNRNLQLGGDNKQNHYPFTNLATLPSQSPPDISRKSSNSSQDRNDSSSNNHRKKRECPICHKFFANLSTHKSTHLTSQDRPHKCVICQRGFARNNDLIRHKKRHWKDNLGILSKPELSDNVELQQDSIAKQRELKKNQLKSLHQIKGAFQCPYNTNLIEVDLELYPHKAQNGTLNFKPIDCHQTGVFSRCDTYKNHLKALHFEYPPRTKREQRSVVPGRCRHCGEKFPNVDVWLNQHVGKTCGFPYH